MSETVWRFVSEAGGEGGHAALAVSPALAWAAQVKADLVRLQEESALPAMGVVSQLIHEAFNLNGSLSRLASEFNQWAGMKWAPDGWQADFGGRPVLMDTWEEVDGSRQDLTDAFAAFPSWDHFLQAYRALLTFPRYRGALRYNSQPLLWLHQVVVSGYATDTRYLGGAGRWMAAVADLYADTLPSQPAWRQAPIPIFVNGEQVAAGRLVGNRLDDETPLADLLDKLGLMRGVDYWWEPHPPGLHINRPIL